MMRMIELKHVGPRAHVRELLLEQIDRLEQKLGLSSDDAASLHVVFEENRAHRLYRVALTCHVPGRTFAAHEECHDAGESIHRAFTEV